MSNASAETSAATEDTFLMACIHDIRLHLRRSLTRAQLLERQSAAELSSEGMSHLTEIVAANREMDGLLKRLAQYALAGSDASEKPLGSLHVMFHSALRVMGNRNVDAEISFDVEPEQIIEVPFTVETILRELLDNALKFRKGPVKITLIVEQSPGKDVIGLRDTGIGFDPQYGEKIMRPLERLHPVSVYPGFGLGLAICQRTVSAWGGKLWAESLAGGGSTFWFSLPA